MASLLDIQDMAVADDGRDAALQDLDAEGEPKKIVSTAQDRDADDNSPDPALPLLLRDVEFWLYTVSE
jgi:hypothetical protein